MNPFTRIIDDEIERRSKGGNKLAVMFNDIPAGLSFTEFLLDPSVAELDLDFITASEMFDAYQENDKK